MNTENRDVGLSVPASLLKNQAGIIFGFVALIWAAELIDWLTPWWRMDALGIIPRTLVGLRGVLFAPFLHGSFAHAAANSIPFIVLSWFILLRGRNEFFAVSIIALLFGGLGTWLTGTANSVHIGASGLIFGYFGFLLLVGFFERRFASLATSFFVVLLYGGLIWGVLPLQMGVSWQSHLFGFMGGILAAYLLAEREDLIDQITLFESE